MSALVPRPKVPLLSETKGAYACCGSLQYRPAAPPTSPVWSFVYGFWVPIVLSCYPGCLSHPFSLGLVALSSGPCGEVYPARKGPSLARPRPLHCTYVARPQAQGPAESESQCRASDDLAVGAMLRHNLTAKVPCLRTVSQVVARRQGEARRLIGSQSTKANTPLYPTPLQQQR